jgi:hypothetical protein
MKIAALLIPIAASTLMLAQEKTQVHTFQMRVPPPAGQPVTDHVFVTGGPALGPMRIEQFGTRSMKGAPYSAEATTESIQVLADGNRIVTKSTSKSWRDSEGRTRTENNLAPMGMWVPEGKNLTLTSIDDPTTGTHYTFNSGDKTATKFSVSRTEHTTAEGKQITISSTSGGVFSGTTSAVGAGEAGVKAVMAGPATMTYRHAEGMAPDAKHEDLGQKSIEGVICDGVRDTFTIAAGQMGNERPIEVVTERWSSKELGMDILRKHSDPRSGETTYRVSNLIRGEQPRNLFELPADVKVEEIGGNNMLRRKIEVNVKDKE